VWWLSVADHSARVPELQSRLPEEERRRADRFLVEPPRQRFVLGRWLARTVLARCRGVAPEQLVFQLGEHGKPELAGVPWPAFNVAHSGDLVVLAVARAEALGVDVEEARRVANAARLAERFFRPAEHRRVAGLAEPERSRSFLHCWTSKEAFLKARGTGIIELGRVEVDPDPDHPPALVRIPAAAGRPEEWALLPVPLPGGAPCVVATRGRGWSLRVHDHP
jgi:4'-phosphopantetheinyl transferase